LDQHVVDVDKRVVRLETYGRTCAASEVVTQRIIPRCCFS